LTTRDQIAYVIASTGTAVSAGLSWFLNSPLLGVATGILLGTLVTDFTQSRAQKRAIRRELAVQNVNNIYGPLYKELGAIQYTATNFNYLRGYEDIDIKDWTRISSEFYYHFILPAVKQQLISFYGLVSKFNQLLPAVNEKVGEFITTRATKFYGFDVVSLAYGVNVDGGDTGTIFLDKLLMFGLHPKKVLEPRFPHKTLKFYVSYSARKAVGHAPYQNDLRDQKDLDRFDELYAQLLEGVKKIDVVEDLNNTLRATLNTLPTVRTGVLKMIQEPWTV
jgi:hypothetical protein